LADVVQAMPLADEHSNVGAVWNAIKMHTPFGQLFCKLVALEQAEGQARYWGHPSMGFKLRLRDLLKGRHRSPGKPDTPPIKRRGRGEQPAEEEEPECQEQEQENKPPREPSTEPEDLFCSSPIREPSPFESSPIPSPVEAKPSKKTKQVTMEEHPAPCFPSVEELKDFWNKYYWVVNSPGLPPLLPPPPVPRATRGKKQCKNRVEEVFPNASKPGPVQACDQVD